MKKLSYIESTMLPLPMSNIDTDQIMPKEFLKRIERSGYGEFLFYDWKKDANFPLNNEIYKESKVLLTGTNFGTGSSREQAATSLKYRGIQIVIAGSFSQTYKRNAINNGFLVIEAPELVDDMKNKFGDAKLSVKSGLNAIVDFKNAKIIKKLTKVLII